MGTLEKVIQLKSDGYSEEDIAEALRQDGTSPKEISDAINQARIKAAVMQDENMQPEFEMQQPPQDSNNFQEAPAYDESAQQFQESQPQQEYQQNPYALAYAQSPSGNYSTNTMIEIAEQVFNEKISPSQRKIEELNELKAIATIKMENIAERLKRLESTIDKLQVSVMDEVSAYGKSVGNLKKEVEMVEDSFSKIVNQVADKSAHIKSKSSKR